jgi:F-type H+-transporting ATPase subunit delta
VSGGLGRRYARALLGLARETNALASAADELNAVAATLDVPDARRTLLSPIVAAADRRAILDEIVGRLGVSPIVANLVRVLAERGRLRYLPDVARAYEALVDRELGRARVRIRSAAALSAEQRRDVEALARRLTGGKDLIVSTEIDADLIGGVVLDAAGTVYDGSVKTQLERLAKSVTGASA